jgi:phage terminase large subunit-like protein
VYLKTKENKRMLNAFPVYWLDHGPERVYIKGVTRTLERLEANAVVVM